MIALSVEWAALGFILAALSAVITIIYNRWLSFEKLVKKQDDYNLQIIILKSQFDQYQKDFKHYLEVCEICRKEVREHHEGRTAQHVTPELREQINHIVIDIAEIKKFLMEHNNR